MPGTWQDIAQKKKAEQISRIPKEWLLPHPKLAVELNGYLDVPRRCGLLLEKELEITEQYDATALAEAIAARRLKSEDVVRAFCKRATIAHQLTNCLTEIFFDDALSRARELDTHLAAGNPPLGPLHGLPVSLKDTFRVPGYDSSTGLASLAFNRSTEPSVLVTLLQNAGAVLYCKTNVPQMLMALDTHNNVFGRTLNPRNLQVTAGGSSGGEGALIAMRGSCLGIGTDLGGSIRIPAMCNGLYSIKPSWQRIPLAGQEGGTLEGSSKLALPASAGPLATSLRDCELLLKTVAGQRPWDIDPDVVPGSWEAQSDTVRHGKAGGKPVIGVVWTDGVVQPLPIINSLMIEVVDSLRAYGVEVVEMDITPLFSKCQSLVNAFFSLDGGGHMFELLAKTGEPLSPWLAPRLRQRKPKTLDEARELHARKERLQKKFLKIWKDQAGRGIDALICPVAAHPVPPVDRWNGIGYTSSWVLLDYPAGIIPVRDVRASDLTGSVPATKPLSSWDKINRELWTEVDRSTYLGTPLCVQVVAPKLQERRLCDAMKVIDDALKLNSATEEHNKTRAKL